MTKRIVGAILTGGKSSRMNFINKSFLNVNNKDFIEIIINTLSKRLEKIYINANQDIEKYQKFNRPIVSDLIKGFKGPLAGLHSIMKQFEDDRDTYSDLTKNYNELFNNVERENNIKEKQLEIHNLKQKIKVLTDEYKENRYTSILKLIINVYKNELLPEIDNLRRLKYDIVEMQNNSNKGESDSLIQLLVEPSREEENDSEEPSVLTFVSNI